MPTTLEVPISSLAKYANFHINADGADLTSEVWQAHIKAHAEGNKAASIFNAKAEEVKGESGLIDTAEKVKIVRPYAEEEIRTIDEINTTNGELKHKEADKSNHGIINSVKKAIHDYVLNNPNLKKES